MNGMSWLAGVIVFALGAAICVGFLFRHTRLGGYFNFIMFCLMIYIVVLIATHHGGSGLLGPPGG